MRKIIVLLPFLALSACAVGLYSNQNSYDTSQTMALRRPATSFVEVASEVGRSLGYKVSGVDPRGQSVRFSANSSMASTLLIGKMKTLNVTAALQPGGREVKLSIMMAGNMGSTSQAKATRILDEFREALEARLNR